MKNNIFMPDKIRVGYQKREGTYTGKLAYVIYYDEKGKLRKETSWAGWRHKNIKPEDFVNEPTEGFVLNKKAGGYNSGWNHRNTYVRVYDPRGFEFEIDVSNLLYILDNTSSIIGKGLEGEFVYGWDGGNLVLIPTSSPDYKVLEQYNKLRKSGKKFKGTDMIVGATYLTKSNEERIYLGRFDEFEDCWETKKHKLKGKKYFFYDRDNADGYYSKGFETVQTLSTKIIDVVSEEPVNDYADIMDKLEGHCMYSPYDPTQDKVSYYKASTIEKHLSKDENRWGMEVLVNGNVHRIKREEGTRSYGYSYGKNYAKDSYTLTENWNDVFNGTLDELVEHYTPYQKQGYLQNGKKYKKGVFTS